MSKLVHVVAPDGTRFERAFADHATPEQILAALRHPAAARLFGRSGVVVKKDAAFGETVPHADKESPWVIEHPDTVVCVGEATPDGGFRETQRLAGPPAEKPAPQTN